MANEIVNINGTPKISRGTALQYFFGPGLIFQGDTTTDSYVQVGPNVSTLHPVAFADITDKLGASDIEEYLDQVATQGLMSVVGTGGGGGTGSRGGFIDYNDTTGPISLTANTWTTIPNDGEGDFTNKGYKPAGVTELMDVSTGAIDPTELSLGDSILIRNDYVVNPATNNSLLEFRYSLGTGAGAYVLEKTVGRLDDGSGRDYRQSVSTDLIYMGDLNTRDNPILLQVRLSGNGTLTNAGSVIQVIKY